MRAYFLGDIHGNNYALEACLKSLDQAHAEKVFCLGDIVGWLPFGDRTLRRIRELNPETVAGNHDLMVAGVFTDHPHQIDRMQASAYNAGLLSSRPEDLDFLANLPLKLETPHFVIVHHSPFHLPPVGQAPTIDCFNYLDRDQLQQCLNAWQESEQRLIISGHDHVPAVYELPDGAAPATIDDVKVYRHEGQADLVVDLRSDARYWVKTGSVGGPYRDGVPLANLAVYDQERRQVILRRLSYPHGALYAELKIHRYCRNIGTLKQYAQLLESYEDSGCRLQA